MFGTFILTLSLAALPQVHRPAPPPDCELEVLPPQALDDRAIAEFNAAVDRYVLLHRRLERYLPPEQMFDDPEAMLEARDDLADMLRAARPNARAGNIFSAGPAQLLRRTIANTLLRHGYDPKDMIGWLNEDPLPGSKRPEVNGRYDWGLGASMWPALLQVLPPLPRELEYRIVGNELVLIDVHAALIVDILENAMFTEEEE